MSDLAHIKTLTTGYESFQGLRAIPGAALFALMAVLSALGYGQELWSQLLFLGLALVSNFVGGKLATSYYVSRFGRARMSPRALWLFDRSVVLPNLGAMLLVSALLSITNQPMDIPGNMFPAMTIFIGAFTLIFRANGGSLRLHHRIGAVCLMSVTFLPMIGAPVSETLQVESCSAIATFLLVTGFFDHRYVVKSFSALSSPRGAHGD